VPLIRRLPLIASVLFVVVTQAGCTECQYYNDCGDGQYCAEGVCEFLEGEACEQAGDSPYFRKRGFLETGEHWTCNLPAVANFESPYFSSYEGPLTLVSGGSGKFKLYLAGANDLAGRTVYIGVRGERTYHALTNVPVTDGRVDAELFISPTAGSGGLIFVVAIDDGTGKPGEPSLGPEIEIPLNIIGVSTGDVQVSITWDSFTDVDLYVRDPAGNVIFYGEKTSPTGGSLDLDSNAACNPPYRQNENVFWAPSSAPSGTYDVWVNLWSQCEHTGLTNWRMTRVLRNEDFEVREGVLNDQSTPEFYPGDGRPPDLSFQF
jgi:hypothetical protein